MTDLIESIRRREAEHQLLHERDASIPSCLPAGCSPDQGDVPVLLALVDSLTEKLRVEREYSTKLATGIVLPVNEQGHVDCPKCATAQSVLSGPGSFLAGRPCQECGIQVGDVLTELCVHMEEIRQREATPYAAEVAHADPQQPVVPESVTTSAVSDGGTTAVEGWRPSSDPEFLTHSRIGIICTDGHEHTLAMIADTTGQERFLGWHAVSGPEDCQNPQIAKWRTERLPVTIGAGDSAVVAGHVLANVGDAEIPVGGASVAPNKRRPNAGRPRNCPNFKRCKGRLKSAADKTAGLCKKCRKATKSEGQT